MVQIIQIRKYEAKNCFTILPLLTRMPKYIPYSPRMDIEEMYVAVRERAIGMGDMALPASKKSSVVPLLVRQ